MYGGTLSRAHSVSPAGMNLPHFDAWQRFIG
jgi:hypothetical protein